MAEYDYVDNTMKSVSQKIEADVFIEWNNDAVINEVISSVATTIHNDIKEKVEKAVFNKLDETVNNVIAGVMDKKVQSTDKWGKPQASPMSITELLQRDVERWLNDDVDNYGSRDGSSYRNQKRAVYLYKKALELDKRDGALTKMILKAIKEQVGDLSQLVNSQIEEAVKKRFNVK